MDTAAYFRDYDNIQDSSTISARLTLALYLLYGHTLYLLYGVLVLDGSDLDFFLHVWDFGKSLFDGADPRTPSETHPVVMMCLMMCQLTLWRSCTRLVHRCTRKAWGSRMEALLGCNRSSRESGVDDI